MTKQLDFDVLKAAVAGRAAAFRCRTTLQPAGGKGTKVFPPTYAGGVYATERRRLPGYDEPVECVLLDSVQSQANRMEEALQQAFDTGLLSEAGIQFPMIEVDFSDYWDPTGTKKVPTAMRLLEPVGKISALQAPHRIADAILRDSLHEGTPFRESKVGESLNIVSPRNATPLFLHCPTALLCGMWDSTGPKGGLGAKFERAIVSEIVGINAVYGVRTASRVDPLIRENPPLYEDKHGDWTPNSEQAVKTGSKKEPKKSAKKLSELNLGNVTPDVARYSSKAITKENRQTVDPMRADGAFIEGGRVCPGGVTIEVAEQTTVISLAALRRLHFPLNGSPSTNSDNAARTVLTALGLLASTLAAEQGLDLRSRCLLWPEERLRWDLLSSPGKTPDTYELDSDHALQLLALSLQDVRAAELEWSNAPVILTPSERLLQVVVASQRSGVAVSDSEEQGV